MVSGVFNMTMNIPAAAQNPSKQHCYGSSSFGVMNRLEQYYSNKNHNHNNNYGCSETCLLLGSSSSSSDHHHHHLLLVSPPPPPPPLMANHQDESRTESVNEAGSSSNYYQDEEEADHHVGWLQLGIGNQSQSQSQSQPQPQPNNNNKVEEEDQEGCRRSSGLVELDLLPTGGSITNNSSSEELRSLMIRDGPRPISSLFVNSSSSPSYNNNNNYTTSSFPLHHQEIINSSWGGFIRPFPRNYNYFARPFQLIHTDGLVASRPPPPPPPPPHANSIDFRVIDPPPPRPHSGIWFMLQAAQIQVKEPFLPQIPKSFLRTRDGRMTIRLVIKYLVNKLKLESESEVEIRCRGQQILPFLTLQHVRDSIWSPRDSFVTLLPTHHDSSSSSSSSSTTAADHVMVLHYGRSP